MQPYKKRSSYQQSWNDVPVSSNPCIGLLWPSRNSASTQRTSFTGAETQLEHLQQFILREHDALQPFRSMSTNSAPSRQLTGISDRDLSASDPRVIELLVTDSLSELMSGASKRTSASIQSTRSGLLGGGVPQSPPDLPPKKAQGKNSSGSAKKCRESESSQDSPPPPRRGPGRKRLSAGSGANEKRIANKICRVCGDKAFSYNFNVITCESCKAFFRRNANKENEIRCPFNEQCEITTLSRRFCQRCRLTKCFKVGMKKEWIMTDEARLEKKQRVEENRERRMHENGRGRSSRASTSSTRSRSRVKSETSPDEPPTIGSNYTSPKADSSQPGSVPSVPCGESQSSSQVSSPILPLSNTMSPTTLPVPNMQTLNQSHALHAQPGLSSVPLTVGQPMSARMPNVPIVPVAQPSDLPSGPSSLVGRVKSNRLSLTESSSLMESPIVQPPPILLPQNRALPSSINRHRTQSVNICIRHYSPLPDLPLCSTSPLCQNLLESVTTSSAHSLSDVTADINTSGQPTAMEVAASCTSLMGTSGQAGFRPPAVNDGLPLTVPPVPNALTMAQAQLAVAQVQVAQQMQDIVAAQAAAVVAATLPPSAPLLPPTMTPSLGNCLGSTLTSSVPPTSHATLGPNMNTQMDNSMVTIPRDMFVKLVEGANQGTAKKEKCLCTCSCGRYTPGTVIADEVSRSILSASHDSESREERFDPATLETTEDLQRSGLLPSGRSSISWLNSARTPNTAPSLDMSDSFFGSNALLGKDYSLTDHDFCALTNDDQEKITELIGANQQTWGAQLEGKEKRRHEEACPDKESMVNMADGAIRRLIRMSKKLADFKKLSQSDQIFLVKNNCMEYLILRGAMAYDPGENAWKGPTSQSGYSIKMDAMKQTHENLLEHSIRFYSSFKEELRSNETVMLLLGQLIVFNGVGTQVVDKNHVTDTYNQYDKCLKRYLFTLNDSNLDRTLSDYKQLIEKLEQIKDLNKRARSMVKEVDQQSMEPLILEMIIE